MGNHEPTAPKRKAEEDNPGRTPKFERSVLKREEPGLYGAPAVKRAMNFCHSADAANQ
jgi:hypothetical protein